MRGDISLEMRFYALVTAFAAVLISNNGNAEETHDSAVSSMKSSIAESLGALKEYRSRRRLASSMHRDENSKIFAQFRIQELEEKLKVAESRGKNVDQCRKILKFGLREALLEHVIRVKTCLRTSGSYFLEDKEISILLRDGEELENELGKFPQECDIFMPMQDCREIIESDVVNWELIIKRMINDEPQATVKETKRLLKCNTSTFGRFEREIMSVKTSAQTCLAALSVRESESTPAVHNGGPTPTEPKSTTGSAFEASPRNLTEYYNYNITNHA